MVRDLRTLAIYGALLAIVLGGSSAAYLAGRRGAAAGGPGPGGTAQGRVIAISLAAEEIIVGLAGPERLAAVTAIALDPRFSNISREAARAGAVVSGTSIERIVRLRPDLVFVSPYTDTAARAALARFGVKVRVLRDFAGLGAIREGIVEIGRAIGEEDRAAAMVRKMDRRIAAARAPIPPGSIPPRILRYDPADAWVAGSGTVIDEVIRLSGGANVAAENGVSGTLTVRKETVARWNPDVLLVEGEPGEEAAVAARLLREPVLEPVSAIRKISSGGLIVLPSRTLASVSQHCVEAVELLAAALHSAPDRGKPGGSPPEAPKDGEVR